MTDGHLNVYSLGFSYVGFNCMLSSQSGGYTGAIEFSKSGFCITFYARHTAGARTLPTAVMLHDILTTEHAVLGQCRTGTCFVQFGDCAEYPFPSIAFGRRSLAPDRIELIPDTYFYSSNGYALLRQSAVLNELPPWRDRRKIVFWRGNPTFSYTLENGTPVTSIDQIARVRMCEKLARDPRADVGLSGVWGQPRVREPMKDVLRQKGILKSKVSMITQAPLFRLTIDIDGVANAWGFFEKLLMGCCVLKIASPYEQWFYKWLRPWTHYVPVRSDFSDLSEKIDWCFEHDQEAEEIGRAGQAVAIAETFIRARRVAAETISKSLIEGST